MALSRGNVHQCHRRNEALARRTLPLIGLTFTFPQRNRFALKYSHWQQRLRHEPEVQELRALPALSSLESLKG